MNTTYFEDLPGRHPLKTIAATLAHTLNSAYVDLHSYSIKSWRLLKLLWDYEHEDYYAVLEVDSPEPKYKVAVYKISSLDIALKRLIATYVGKSEEKILVTTIASVLIDSFG
jgi:transposase